MTDQRYEPVLDASGRRIPKLRRYKKNGLISVRAKFRKLGIPDLDICTGERTLGRAKQKAEILIQRHKNKHLGVDDTHVFGRHRTTSVKEIIEWVLANHTPHLRAGTQEMHRYYFKRISAEFGFYDISQITNDFFRAWVQTQKTRRLRKGERRRTTFFDYAKHLNMLIKVAYDQRFTTNLVKIKNPDPLDH